MYVLTDPDLSLKAKGFYALLAAMEARTGPRAPTSLEALYRASRDGRDSTASAILELEGAGYLTRNQTQRRGRNAVTSWTLNQSCPPATARDGAA